ncbi:MAG TPA: type II toxin-antitoxin system Phd/YefM family antitoxin [Thermoanaerobaculia bacterium]|nr:type II toxin-antitoxin system Phd/YefM family antitoxin [Thermoanaerobaculia bacterium]
MHLKEDVLPISEFRSNAATLVRKVREGRRALILTQRGRSAAVLLDAEDYEDLLEEIEILRDVQTALKELEAGKGVTHAKARSQVLKTLSR